MTPAMRFVLVALLGVVVPACGTGGGAGTLSPTVAPAAPTSLESRSGNGKIVLSWDPSPAAARYTIKRSSNSGGPFAPLPAGTAVAGTTFIDSLVTNGQRYYYAVSAINSFGESANSAEIAAQPGFVGSSLATGTSHSLALLMDGTLWTWGSNGNFQLGDGSTRGVSAVAVPVAAPAGAIAIAAGKDHNLAAYPDGTVWAWGGNEFWKLGDGSAAPRSPPFQIPGISGAVQVAAGDSHSMVLMADGTVWAWGKGMGPGAATLALPQPVAGLSGVVQIDAAGDQAFALQEDGTLWAWGRNDYGQLGIGTAGGPVSTPTRASNLTAVIRVAAGQEHAIALRSDGTVWGWGYNGSAQPVPALVSGINGAVSIAAGGGRSLATKSDGSVWGWGSDGPGALAGHNGSPAKLPALSGIRAVSAAKDHTLALGFDGEIWSFGDNLLGQLGAGTGAVQTLPRPVSNLTDVVSQAGGTYHTLALRTDGSVWGWGNGGQGELGPAVVVSGNTTFRVAVAGPMTPAITSIAAGGYFAGGGSFSLALTSAGTVYSWGTNFEGKLGTASVPTQSATPVAVDTLTAATPDTTITAVAAGANHSIALASSGIVWTWGSNSAGQLGNNSMAASSTVPVQASGLAGATAIAAGYSHCLAIVGSGAASAVWAWGSNETGQLGFIGPLSRSPVQVSGITGVSAVAAGRFFSIALKTDGTVWAWGNNTGGELGDGSPAPPSSRETPGPVAGLTGVVAIAAGVSHGMALLGDGSVRTWGWNGRGELGNALFSTGTNSPVSVDGLPVIVRIAAGQYHSLAVGSDGSAWAWGWNASGQVGIGSNRQSAIPILVTH